MPQRNLIKTVLIIVAVLFASYGVVRGQTRTTTFSFPFTLGWEGTIGSSNQRTVIITNIGRRSSQISWLAQDSQAHSLVVHVKSSDGLEIDTIGGADSEPANSNDTKTLSRNSGLISGTITFTTTETFSTRYNRYVSDVAVQVVAQTLDAQGKVISSVASVPSGDTTTVDSSFLVYGELSSHVQTGLTITNNTGQSVSASLNAYTLFSHTSPYAATTVTVAAGQSVSGTLDVFFPNLASNDGGGGKITDGNVGIDANQLLTVTAFRLDDGIRSDAPMFLGRATGPLPNSPPVLLLEQGTDLAAAVDAQTHIRDTFSIMTTPWFGGDGHTRVMLFAQNVQLQSGEGANAVQVVENGITLPTEDVRPVPDFPSWSQIMVRLSDGLPSGTLSVTITFHAQTSNA